MKSKKNLLLSLPFWLVAVASFILIAFDDAGGVSIILFAASAIFGYTAFSISRSQTHGYILGILLSTLLIVVALYFVIPGESRVAQCGTEYEDGGCRFGAAMALLLGYILLIPAIVTGITIPFLITGLKKKRIKKHY